MANTTETVLNLKDMNASADLPTDANAEDPRAQAIPSTAKLRLNGDSIEVSINNGVWTPIGSGAGLVAAGYYNVMDYGAVADGVTDNIPAFEATLAALPNLLGARVVVPPGTYRFSRALHIDRPCVFEGSGTPNNTASTIFTFPDGSDGIVIDRFNTNPNNFEGTVGDAAVVRFISVRQESGTAGGHGIRLFARAVIEDCQIVGFEGDGVRIAASFGGTSGEVFPTWAPSTAYTKGDYIFGLGGEWYVCHQSGTSAASGGPTGTPFYTTPIVDGGCLWSYISGTNANGWFLNRLRILACGGNGVNVFGADSNAGLGIAIDVDGCTGYAIRENSFLGNTWIACQCAACGGSYDVGRSQSNARNLVLGCYNESDTPGPYVEPPSQLIGGLILGANGGGMIFQSNGFNNPIAFAAANTMVARIGGSTAAPDSLVTLTYGNDGASHDLKYLAPATTAAQASNDIYVMDLANSDKSFGFGHSTSGVLDQSGNYEPRTAYNSSFFTWNLHGIYNEGNRIIHTDDYTGRTETQYHFGDLIFRRGFTTGITGDNIGWVCTDSGNLGTYSEGRTATTNGTTTMTLSAASAVLKVGDIIRIAGGGPYVIRGMFGTTVTLSGTPGAGSGQAITYQAPVFAAFGQKLGNIGDSTGIGGNATLNNRHGVSSFAAGQATCTITTNRVPASACVVHATLQFADATLTQILHVIPNPAGGSFVVTGNAAATANTRFSWSIDE